PARPSPTTAPSSANNPLPFLSASSPLPSRCEMEGLRPYLTSPYGSPLPTNSPSHCNDYWFVPKTNSGTRCKRVVVTR
ncbi:hypothetical protein, partial [Porphyromonas endodontalis]|uniref:hypothetical protein n=1 Tax=Porphyromonas endodontalis TaxID=28124 RepID=UPI0028EBF8EC